MNEASALAVNCHTSLCILSHPKRKGKERKGPAETRTHDLLIASPILYRQRHDATQDWSLGPVEAPVVPMGLVGPANPNAKLTNSSRVSIRLRHVYRRFLLTNWTHSRLPAHIKGRAAVLLDYVMPASAMHERHEASPTSRVPRPRTLA